MLASTVERSRLEMWDLRGAMLKKQEVETARLLDFEFRHRVRTMRLLANKLGLDADELARRTVLESDPTILTTLVSATGLSNDAIEEAYRECAADARRQLIEERGSPLPHRLA